jgi:glycosyltransferase involved in cell wall biosynthesis
MRIALLHPTYWPEVRRGSERVVHDLGATLARGGHDVTLLTSHRGPRRVSTEEGVRVVRARRLPRPPGAGLLEHHVENVPNVTAALRRERYDVVQAFHPADSWAAVRVRERGGPPVIATLHGVPTRQYLIARRRRLDMALRVAAGADECTVLSAAAADPYERYLFRTPRVLPPGIDLTAFPFRAAPPAERPTLLCTASLGDPRKRGPLLMAAFGRLRERVPQARLLVVRGRDPVLSRAEPQLPPGAEYVELDHRSHRLAEWYGSASASVLPSVDEAFGLVLIESLASGTPVVAARSGAAPEIVTDERVGVLFEPDDEADLARAMERALGLGSNGATAELSREHASAWDWERLVGDYEALYESVNDSASTAV